MKYSIVLKHTKLWQCFTAFVHGPAVEDILTGLDYIAELSLYCKSSLDDLQKKTVLSLSTQVEQHYWS